jgi:hypothetical protein
MATLTVNTGNVARQFGTFSAQISMTHTSDVTTTMKMANMPKISQDFDVQEEVSDITEFRTNLSEVSLDVFDELGNGDSFFTYIDALGLGDTIQVQITTPSGTDYFITTKASCEYDWFSRKISIKAQAALRYSVQVTNYDISSYETSGETNADDGLIVSTDVITAFLEAQGSSPTLKILGHFSSVTKSDITSIPSPTTTRYLIFDSQYVNTYAEGQDVVLKLSIVEGAVVGAMMGYSFYVRRNFDSTSNSDYYAQIGSSDLKSFGVSFNDRHVRDFDSVLAIQDNIDGAQISTSETEEIDATGAQDISINYFVPDMHTAFFDITESPQKWELATTGASALSQSDMDDISDDARDSYKKSLGITSSYSVDFEIFGISTLKPYQFIQFDSGIHPTINSKKVRPSYLEYDLESDTIKGEGYIIG